MKITDYDIVLLPEEYFDATKISLLEQYGNNDNVIYWLVPSKAIKHIKIIPRKLTKK